MQKKFCAKLNEYLTSELHLMCHLLLNPWTDFDKTLDVHRVDSELVHRQLLNSRFRPQTGSRPFIFLNYIRLLPTLSTVFFFLLSDQYRSDLLLNSDYLCLL